MKKPSLWILGMGALALMVFTPQVSSATTVRLMSLPELTNSCGPNLIIDGEITNAENTTDNMGWPAVLYTFKGSIKKVPSGGYTNPYFGKPFVPSAGSNTFQIKMYGNAGKEMIRGFMMPKAGLKGTFFITGAAANSGNAGFCGGPGQAIFTKQVVDGNTVMMNRMGNTSLRLNQIAAPTTGEGAKFQALQKSLQDAKANPRQISPDNFNNVLDYLIQGGGQ